MKKISKNIDKIKFMVNIFKYKAINNLGLQILRVKIDLRLKCV